MRWHVTSLEGCEGYREGYAEYAVVDDDGGICKCVCPNGSSAAHVARLLNIEERILKDYISKGKNFDHVIDEYIENFGRSG